MDILLIAIGIILMSFGSSKQREEIKLLGTIILVIGLALVTIASMRSCSMTMPK